MAALTAGGSPLADIRGSLPARSRSTAGPVAPVLALGVTRSRTSLFLSYRDSAARSGPTPSTPFTRYAHYDDDDDDDPLGQEERGLIHHPPRTPALTGAVADASALPPRWVDEADQVDAILARVRPNIAQLDRLHAKHLLPGFKDRSLEEREIQALANSITSDFRVCQAHLRRIAEQSQQLLAHRPRTAVDADTRRIELVMAANVQTALATKVQDLSAQFRKNQAEYLRQLRGHESKAVELQNRATTVYDPLVALADDEQASRSALSSANGAGGASAGRSTPSLAQQQFFASSTLATPASSTAVDARTAEIAAIAHSIADLADLFKDLSSLVIDQGTLLDRVDWNVELMSREVRSAGDELVQATRIEPANVGASGRRESEYRGGGAGDGGGVGGGGEAERKGIEVNDHGADGREDEREEEEAKEKRTEDGVPRGGEPRRGVGLRRSSGGRGEEGRGENRLGATSSERRPDESLLQQRRRRRSREDGHETPTVSLNLVEPSSRQPDIVPPDAPQGRDGTANTVWQVR